MDEKINITYETLFNILRSEKNTGELQKLNETFYEDVVSYLNGKENILKKEENVFSEAERDKTQIQIQNIKKILKELYERREKKIIELALNKSRTNSDIIDLSALLSYEKKLFQELVNIFSSHRDEILINLINGKQPTLKESIEESSEEKTEIHEEREEETKTVRFIHPVPKFLGKELEIYGPFEADDIAKLPKDIADVLVRKGRAEEIKE